MNALDQPISEVSVKIDNEDMSLLLKIINIWGESVSLKHVEDKLICFSIRKLRHKLENRIYQTKGTVKPYTLKLEPVQAYTLITILSTKHQFAMGSYEGNFCEKMKNEFHQKLLAI